MKGLFLLIGIASLSAGCALTREVPLVDCEVSRSDVVSKLDLRGLVQATSIGICDDFDDSIGNTPIPLVVPDVVDVQTLLPGTIGVALGELMRTAVFDECKLPVRQIDISGKIRLNDDGVTMLSRGLADGQERKISAAAAIIGAYSLERGRLTLTVRRLRIEDSTIQKITTRTLTYACRKPPVGRAKFRQELS